MATGYTYPVAEGKVTKFKDFALMCARAFGALIEMRDEAMEAPLPKEIKPSDYHLKKGKEAKAALAKVANMTVAQTERAAASYIAKRLQSEAEADKERETENARLEKMLAQVNDWTPPSADHKEMKRFMIDQLKTSIREKYQLSIPKDMTGAEWQSQELACLTRDLQYHNESYAAECRRAADRNEWLQKLRESL